MLKKENCKHEWRAVENFYKEVSREERLYTVYCKFCRQVSKLKLNIKT